MLNAGDGLSLHLHEFPVPNPRATLAVVHGYGEHGGRYAHVARAFNDAQISVYAIDLRGHGRSAGRRAFIERFDDYHLDVSALLEVCRNEGQGPLFLFGHSMGALIALHWILAGGGKDLRGLLLSSPLIAVQVQVPKVKAMFGRLMSRVWPRLCLPSGLRGADVTRDSELANLYDHDPLNNKDANARWFTEAEAAMERVLSAAGTLTLPTLLLYGGADRVASAAANDRLASALRMKDREVERLDGFYHELVNEPLSERTQVIARLTRWLEAHLDAVSARASL